MEYNSIPVEWIESFKRNICNESVIAQYAGDKSKKNYEKLQIMSAQLAVLDLLLADMRDRLRQAMEAQAICGSGEGERSSQKASGESK